MTATYVIHYEGRALIEVTFTEKIVYKRSAPKDCILMSVKKLKSGIVVNIGDNFPGFAQLQTLQFPPASPRVQSTVYFNQETENIIIVSTSQVHFEVDIGQIQRQGNCVNWEEHPTDCLQKNVFLWKANDYSCYENREKEHDKVVWLCKNCASPRKRGEGLPCKLHPGFGRSYYIDSDEAEGFELQPVMN